MSFRATVPDREAREVFDLLRQIERYPEVSRAIVGIDVDREASTSIWQVRFREGIVTWTERDEFDEAALEMRFELIDGDLERLAGRWRVMPAEGGCEIELHTDFDFGIPSLSHLVDPLAARMLYENGVELLQGLVGGEATVETPPPEEPEGELDLSQWDLDEAGG
jgi:ribosome-associated toxin RatA of RatAB toxin-antitoxin module